MSADHINTKTYYGLVECIRDDMAHLILECSEGQPVEFSEGQPIELTWCAKELAAEGIFERDSFTLRVTIIGDDVNVEWKRNGHNLSPMLAARIVALLEYYKSIGEFHPE